MPLKKIFLICLFSLLGLSSFAQTIIEGPASEIRQDGNSYNITYENAMVKILFCTSNMVRFRVSWDGQFLPDEHYMVVKHQWPEVKISLMESDEYYELSSSMLNVRINRASFLINILDTQNQIIYSSVNNFTHEKSVGSIASMAHNEHFFGFGERMDFLDQRGKKVALNVGRGTARPHIIGAYNVLEANYCPVPFFMSTKGYGIFFHNAYPTEWDMGWSDPAKMKFSAQGGEMDFYFIYGPEFLQIIDDYTALTGKSPLMNQFAFGLHVGTYSGGTWNYEHLTSTHYVVALAKKFRALGIPIDILHLDSTWRIFGEHGGKGATSFEWRETFTDPEAMFDSLYDLNLNMVGLHLRPRFDNGKNLRLLDSARSLGYVYPEANNPGEFVNFFDEEAVNWWWENGVMRIAEQGAKFLKTDEGSAFGALANESSKMGPTGDEINSLHNIFPLVYAKAPYEKFQAHNHLRGMNHTREGYAGIQRYPFIFAGDWPSEWQYFEPVIKAGLNIGISGVGYWAHCMGGFEHPADPELYIRWCQFGLMSPVAHLFGMDHPGYKEPWNYGEEALDIFRQYDQMRYRLIPYLYSTAWQMYQTGAPIMRALVLENQNDINTYNITDQYMLGESIMVCPVTTKGAQTRTLYLPEGQWISHWSGEIYEGKQYIQVVTPLDQMPIFYKSGAIIPSQPDIQYVNNQPWPILNLDIYPGFETSFQLYEDDGTTLKYKEGDFATTAISYRMEGKKGLITIAPALGKFDVPERKYLVKIHQQNAPAQIIVRKDNEMVKIVTAETAADPNQWNYNSEKKELLIVMEKKKSERILIEIQ